MNFALILMIFLTLTSNANARERFFQIQSIDTMKFSRDIAREKLKDLTYDSQIEIQLKNIAGTGATHVALGTPYDEEFLPFLQRWVKAARNNGLNVWFRGNFSGWEKWFDYEKISREEHIGKTKEFIINHPDLFADGDIFTSCPECENGGPGDPRMTGDAKEFKKFLINEYQVAKESFQSIGKNVAANYFSMNGDVARLIMDKETTKALDGNVTIDHYVSSSDRLANDVKDYAQRSKGKVILGEFGAPIPDLHGKLSEKEQADWIDQALKKLIEIPEVVGINYWTNMASSTELWNKDYTPRQAVEVLEKYFNPINISGMINDNFGKPLKEVTVKSKHRTIVVGDNNYRLAVLDGENVTFSKNGYIPVNISFKAENGKDQQSDIILAKSYPSPLESLFTKIINFLKSIFY